MNKKITILFLIISILFAANLYMYLLKNQRSLSGINEQNHLLNERILIGFSERYSTSSITDRNIFISSGENKQTKNVNFVHKEKKTKIVTTQHEPEQASSENMDLNSKQMDLIKLLGVVDGNSRRKCYLLRQSEKVIASEGDTVFGYYMIESIDVGSVTIKDLNNNLIKTVPISGK